MRTEFKEAQILPTITATTEYLRVEAIIYLHKPIQKMSSTLYIGVRICRKFAQGIKNFIKENDKISSHHLHISKNGILSPKEIQKKESMEYKPANSILTFAMLYKASQA